MNTTTQNIAASNDLRHSIWSVDSEGNPLKIDIRLNDDCKNGHQDFSITATGWTKGKPKTDWNIIYGGCCHDTILEANPELQIFVNLHLADYEGIPMYAVENGFYHLTEGFNNTKPDAEGFKDEFCKYYRLTGEQFDVLSTSKNSLQYALNLEKLGILSQWKVEANKAIEILEEMTGKKFLVDSVKTQYHAPTKEAIAEEEEKQRNGYYTPEAEQAREQAKIDKVLLKLQAERDKEVNKANEEYEVKKQVLIIGGTKALNCCIYYNHSRTLSFNWKSYELISNELYNKIADAIQLPEGVKIENKQGKD